MNYMFDIVTKDIQRQAIYYCNQFSLSFDIHTFSKADNYDFISILPFFLSVVFGDVPGQMTTVQNTVIISGIKTYWEIKLKY